MSLKRFLEKPEVKVKFKEEFTKPRFKYSKEILAEPMTSNYGLVGTAFDYIARFHVEFVNKDKTVISRPWVAENYIERSVLLPASASKYKLIIDEAQARKRKFVEDGIMTDDLIESAIRLAKIDIIHRSAYPEDETFDIVESNDIEDIWNLYNLFIKHDWTAKEICLLNPTFGEASLMVGGADADLIIDDMLIDLKSVQKAGMKRPDFDQLMGYFLLNEVGGITEYEEKREINKIAVYSSRFSELMVLNVDDVFDLSHLQDMKKWIVNMANSI